MLTKFQSITRLIFSRLFEIKNWRSCQINPPKINMSDDRRRGPRRNRPEENKEDDIAEEVAQEVGDSEAAQPSDEESGEELIGDGMMRDYLPNPELDRYEQEGIDDEQDFDELDFEQREAAEREIAARQAERRAQQQRRMPQALRELSEGGSDDDEIQREFRERRQREYRFEMPSDEDVEDESAVQEEEKYLDIEECRGKLKVWITEDRTKNWIKRTFKRFLQNFALKNDRGDVTFSYKQAISEMCNKNKQSLEVEYNHLVNHNSTLSLWVAEEPALIFPLINEVANRVANRLYTGYYNIQEEIFVRITQLPIQDQIRELRQKHLGNLIRVVGVITKRSVVYSQLKTAVYVCIKCGDKKGPFYLENNTKVQVGACANCQSQGPFKLFNEDLVYRNYQKINLQEPPSLVPPGRVPRQKEVILLADNIDIARPGDEVEVTGVYTHKYDYLLNVKHGFPLFSTLIEANYVKRVADSEDSRATLEELDQIKQLSRDPNIAQKIISSIAPSIYGHHNVKTALALAMFGGQAKDVGGKHKIRGDINVLLLGDPGTAKSQFLKNVEKLFYRSVYTTGKGASAVGLTASVRRDFATREWSLEGGALVLADKGICLIDEFDKMNEHDRTSIHEAMEQQSISISKAGIVANLQARCSVIAAANPLKGKYDSQLSFHDNVDLTDPILSRFDILCVIKDEICPDVDDALASFVINSHIKNHPHSKRIEQAFIKQPELYQAEYYERVQSKFCQEPTKPRNDLIPLEILKQYIIYARQKVHPKIQNIDQEKIIKFYTMLRQEAEMSGGINIAVRHLESIIRMSEAHARMHLRDNVNDIDVSVAISVMLDSFIQSQKFSVAKKIKSKFSHYITFRDDNKGLLRSVLDKLYREKLEIQAFMPRISQQAVKVPIEILRKEAKQLRIAIPADFFEDENFRRVYKLQGDSIMLK